MPLADLTDSPPDDGGPKKVYIYGDRPEEKKEELTEDKGEKQGYALNDVNTTIGNAMDRIVGRLTGTGGYERYQTWPEKMVREAVSAPHDAMTGELPMTSVDPLTGEVHTSSQAIEAAQAIAGMAGTGGLSSMTDATLGSTPFLRPALKYGEKIYKAPANGQHLDAIPPDIYPEFQRQAMSGEDISNFNFGFMNHKGQFLDRQKALDYALEHGLVDQDASKYGALTSTLMSDSSQPGVAIEALAKAGKLPEMTKSNPDWGMAKSIDKNLSGDVANAIDTWVGGPHDSLETGFGGGVWHPGKLKEVLKNPELKAQLDEAIKPFKDDLRAKHGNTVSLYRYSGKLPEGAKSDRELLSFSSDPKVPEKLAGISPNKKLFSDEDISAKEKEFAKDGKVKIGRYTLTKNEYGSLDIDDPSVGGFLTDTPSVSDWMKELNDTAKEHNSGQAEKAKLIHQKNIPIDDIVYATDRFGQKEFIVKNNGTLFNDNRAGTGISAMKASEQPFFSAVEHAVNNTSQPKMTGSQWLGTLSNKPGVKPEEMQWTGLQDFLKENGNKPVTKEQVQEHLANNKVELKEVKKGARDPLDANEQTEYDALKKRFDEKDFSLNADDAARYAELGFKAKRMPDSSNPTKYHGYQLPGGSNYREMLMTLPDKKVEAVKGINTELINKYGSLGEAFEKWTPEEQTKFDAIHTAAQNFKNDDKYTSSHWDEPNILAHVRMNDRTIDGKKSLHLEEIQSDWHQQGRDKGYRQEQEKRMADLVKQRDEMIKNNPEKIDELNELHDKIRELGVSDPGVPDAPFKKTWHELALKRMIREAAEKGYDRLSWTPGEAQAARYDLSKSVDSLLADPNKDGTFNIVGRKNGANAFEQKNVTADKLPDIVGKEAAKNLLAAEKNKYGMHELKGQQLKIGGEGMKGFYDSIIPKAIEKIGKEHGVKVQKGELPGKLSNKMGQPPETHPVHFIDIPQSLRDTAMHKGFPLFSGGLMFTPVAGDPTK